MSKIDRTYLQGLSSIMGEGYLYEDPNRKGVYRKEIMKYELRHELSDGFPIISLKQSFFKGAIAELLFFLSGSTDIRDLWKRGVKFWDKDWIRYQKLTEEELDILKFHFKRGDDLYDNRFAMGKIYPYQYRSFNGRIDQIAKAVETLRVNPMSTSNIVNAWNPDDLDDMALPPCHFGFQIIGRPLSLSEREMIYNRKIGWVMIDGEKIEEAYSEEFDKHGIPKYGFEIHWQQRSTDYFLGTPVNIQYYAAMAHLFEILTGHKALAVQGDLKNVHLYDNQFEQAEELLKRDPDKFGNTHIGFSEFLLRVKNEKYYPKVDFDEILDDIKVNDFMLDNYDNHGKLSAEMLTRDS